MGDGQTNIWPEAVIDYDLTYELIPISECAECHCAGAPFDPAVAPSLVSFRVGAGGLVSRVLNPHIEWSPVEGATMYRIAIFDETRQEGHLPEDFVTAGTSFHLPIKDSLYPGHSYTVRVQAGDGLQWGGWSEAAAYRVAGTEAGNLLPHVKQRNPCFDTKSPRYGYPVRKEMLTLAECLAERDEIRKALRPYFAPFAHLYQDFIQRVHGLGYRFKSTQFYTPEDLGKPLAFLRYDIHVWDIAATYGVLDANFHLGVAADYHLTWELAPFERSYARDFANLKKFAKGTDLVQFGFHSNPVRSWLIAEKFRSHAIAYNQWWRSKKAVADFVELGETGKCSLGTLAEFQAGAEAYFLMLAARFKKHFPEATTLSHHGQIPGFPEALRSVKTSAARQRLKTLDVVTFTSDEERLRKANFTLNHKSPHLQNPDMAAWVWDPIAKDGLNPAKWAEIEEAACKGRTMFLYIHPSLVYRLEELYTSGRSTPSGEE